MFTLDLKSSKMSASFNLLKNIKQFPSKDFFEKKVISVEEASKEWLPIQKKIKKTRKL